MPEIGSEESSSISQVDVSRVMIVSLPNARWEQISLPVLKLETNEKSTEGMLPRNLWQVYALGGVMLARWIWARWQERKKKQLGSSDGEEKQELNDEN